ncbi:MAG: beta-phosphoglucomutase family hydrolase [Spirochaetes bacterium]|nr:beta-phosphoglucomutase family hydrolase [Spirochaetota bacterium]
MGLTHTFSRDRFDAVLFDLDGVLTPTAVVHSRCWKQMFDEFLTQWSGKHSIPFQPFESQSDYPTYVDGKPRYDGVQSFLESRGIQLPHGDPSAEPGMGSICALGNRKEALFHEMLDAQGVEPYPTSVIVVKELRRLGFKTGVVSSSKNCRAVLKAARIEDLFDIRVDGIMAAERGLAGKPAPDTFMEGARGLGVPVKRAVVVEDAISGVQAGSAGGFGLVIGIARRGDAAALKKNGADIVVSDLGELL